MKPAFPATLPPLFTEPAECQDCYKCIRQCPVKAIRVQDGHAAIVAEHCIGCGTCVEVCPAGSKHIRNDTERARLLIQRKERVFVSLAPSYRTEFGNVGSGSLIEALLALGFSGVSLTALGAQEVTAATAAFLKTAPAGPCFSSACLVTVDLVKKYYHDWDGRVSDLLSPALAHAQLLRHWYGQDCGVVFIGPCIAKKRESDAFPHLIDVTLTFPELRQWLSACGKLPEGNTPLSSAAQFVPHPAQEGMLYPVDGGMLAGLREHSGFTDVEAMAFSGIGAIRRVLDNLHEVVTDKPLFIELLACEGGCVNGPCTAKRAEAYDDEAVDYVLTTEEFGAMLYASAIEIERCTPLVNHTVAPALRFGFSGGVTQTVGECMGSTQGLKAVLIDGLDKKAVSLLKSFAQRRCTGNFVEVMSCSGGCVAGPVTLEKPTKAKGRIDKLLT